MSNQRQEREQWRWRYSSLTGIMYGPIPVGIIGLIIFVIIYFAFFR